MRTTVIKPLFKLVMALGLGAAATLHAAETRQAQTITFAPIVSMNLDKSPATLTATASSGLPVSYVSTLPQYCTVSGNTVTLLGLGNCRIVASQAGNALYAPAPDVEREFYLLKVRQSIIFPGLSNRVLGSEPFIVSATTTSGLAVLFTSGTPQVCRVVTDAQGVTRVTLLTTGSCKVEANQPGNGVYNPAVMPMRSFLVTAPSSVQVYYVHPDQIGSPRAITRASDNQLMWQWKNEEAFGDNEADEDPMNMGTKFVYNLRFPGQVHDKETKTNYNRFRDYEPEKGRYIQSDPIGLAGGISTYGYAEGNTLSFIDPEGLQAQINLFDPSDRAYRFALMVPQGAANEVYGHGSPAGMWSGPIPGGRYISAKSLADALKKSPNYDPNLPTKLLGCNVGKGAYCQAVATALGSTVHCYDETVWYGTESKWLFWEQGTVNSWGKSTGPGGAPIPNYSQPGRLVTFTPRKAK